MRRKRLATLWWPGLSEIWVAGKPWGLVAACAAAGLLNLALLGSFAWTEPFSPSWRMGLWSTVAVAWVGWAVFAAVKPPPATARNRVAAAGQDTFGEAQQHYLRGQYIEAQRVLVELLGRNRRDVEARLMLATLLRRTRSFGEAEAQLAELERFEDAEPWLAEIARERQLIRTWQEPNPDPDHQTNDAEEDRQKTSDAAEADETEPTDHVDSHTEQSTHAEQIRTDDQPGAIRPAA